MQSGIADRVIVACYKYNITVAWVELAKPGNQCEDTAINKRRLLIVVAYRRNITSGGSYFFTVAIADRPSMLLTERIDDLRRAIKLAKKKRPFSIEAIVILPDHIHSIWTLPKGDVDYSLRWWEIKSHFSRSIPNDEKRSRGLHKQVMKKIDILEHKRKVFFEVYLFYSYWLRRWRKYLPYR